MLIIAGLTNGEFEKGRMTVKGREYGEYRCSYGKKKRVT